MEDTALQLNLAFKRMSVIILMNTTLDEVDYNLILFIKVLNITYIFKA